MLSLRFRLPGREAPLGHWLKSLFPDMDRPTRRDWVVNGFVRIEGSLADRLSLGCPAGSCIEVSDLPDTYLPALAAILAVPKGQHSRWIGLVDHPAWPGGVLRLDGKPEVAFRIGEARDGLALIHLEGSACSAETVASLLAEAKMPLVADFLHGGLGVVGGLRLYAVDGDEAFDEFDESKIVWPREPAWCEAGDSAAMTADSPRLQVSDETARAIRRGHPWVLPDRASDSALRFKPGSLLRVVSRAGEPLAWARAEGDARLAARVWAAGSDDLRQATSIEARVAKAIARRRGLLDSQDAHTTNAFRLIHGEGDDLPGLIVDRLGPLLRVLVTSRASEGIRDRVIAALTAQLPLTPEGEAFSVLELLHLRSEGASLYDRVRWLSGGVEQLAEQVVGFEDEGFLVCERGLTFLVDPGWATPQRVRPGYGLFLDQRENRARLDRRASRGGSWLNLFAHTGAFSASLLAAGAAKVTSVDLSAAYLARLESNLSLNQARGVDPACHESVRSDGRRFLEKLGATERFDGIVLDPPTAAAAGRRFWSLQRDLEPLVRLCVDRLAAGGSLLVTQNRIGPPLGLDRVLERAANRAHRSIARLKSAPAGLDFPARAGFPEGDSFEGWLLELD
ncbi:MAG: class I SAM-dependent methyltransferase [Myxococcota bacterium]